MSASTHVKTPPPSDVTADRSDRRPGITPWILFSLGVHGLLAAWLLSRPPVIAEKTGKTEARTITASASEIHQVVEQVRMRQANEIRDKVQELLDLQKALAAARIQKLDEYKNFAKNQAGDALEKALAAERSALPAQEKAIAAAQMSTSLLEQTTVTWTQFSQGDDGPTRKAGRLEFERLRKEAQTALEAAKQAQIEADVASADALNQLTFVPGDEVLPVRQAQEEARKSQTAANTAQDEIAVLVGGLNDQLSRLNGRENLAGQARSSQHSIFERVKNLNEQIERLQKEVVKIEGVATKGTSKAELDRAASRKIQAEKIRTKISQTQSDLAAQTAKIEPSTQKAAAAKALADEIRQAVANQIVHSTTAQTGAITIQTGGFDEQKKALALLEALLAAPKIPPAATNASPAEAQADTPGAPFEASSPASLEGMSFGELYAVATKAETATTSDFRDVRAATGAVLKKTTLNESRKITDVVQPNREKIDESLLTKDITTAQDASAHSQSVRKALGEIDSMLSLSRKMLETTVGEGSKTVAAVSLEDADAQSKLLAKLEAAALNDADAQAKDISELMKGEHTHTGGEHRTPSNLGNHSSQHGPVAAPNTIWPLAKGGANAVPGRMVMANGGAADWIFVDSWYIIGPFPNPQRRNLNTIFPPESVIDLDATYAGINDKPIHWRFVQSPEAMVTPSQPGDSSLAIYYAYTELWFDQEMDAWIALASDDFGKVWVNGLPVWKSGVVAKPWIVDEAFRKVHFKRGLNKVLFRVENCYMGTAFSFSVCTRKTAEAAAP